MSIVILKIISSQKRSTVIPLDNGMGIYMHQGIVANILVQVDLATKRWQEERYNMEGHKRVVGRRMQR